MSTRPAGPDLPVRHVTAARVLAVRGDVTETRDDTLVGEEPLEIRAAGLFEPAGRLLAVRRAAGRGAEVRRGGHGCRAR